MRWIILFWKYAWFAPFPSLKVHHPKRTIYKNRRNEERHGGRNSIRARKVRPAIFRQKRFRYTSPKFYPLSLFFPSTSPSFFSLSSSSSSSFALFCPSRIPLPLSSRPNKMGQNTKRTKPQIYNFAMRIIIEYQKLCYSLFHSAHLLPQRAVFPRRGNKSSRWLC